MPDNQNSPKAPKVSVVVISYNQEKFIKQALDGFVKQKTNFDFEVIIGDDGSTDKTQAIIKRYADSHPETIKPILRQNNIGALPNFVDVLGRTKGKYLAICEGDDYWTDPKKLQLQADFLDSHSDYALCFHPVRVVFENNEQPSYIFPGKRDQLKFSIEELLANNFIQTNSVMYRRQPDLTVPANIIPDDWYLHVYHAQSGKIGFINKVMSTYRRHKDGMWWGSHSNREEIWKKYGIDHTRLFLEFKKLFPEPRLQKIIDRNLYKMLSNLIGTDLNQKTSLYKEAQTKFPNSTVSYAIDTYQKTENL